MSYKLEPLDFTEEIEEFDAFNESKKIEFKKCSHRWAKIENGVLRCDCGSSWEGAGIQQLEKILHEQS
jgi:hypothetical protein